MRITYLVTGGATSDAAQDTVLAQADHLASRHDTETVAVFRPTIDHTDIHDRVRPLIDAHTPTRESALDERSCRTLSAEPSALFPGEAADHIGFSLLSDIELRHAVTNCVADVLVAATPELASMVAHLAPAGTVTVGLDYRAGTLHDAGTSALLSRAPWLDALVAPAEPARAWLTVSLGAAAPLVTTIPPAAPGGYRPRSGLRTATVLIVTDPQHPTDHALRAFARVAGAHPNWSLRVRGAGADRSRLQAVAGTLDLHDRVEFLERDHSASEAWAAASIGLLPAASGSTCAPLALEAFAAGVPTVCYDVANGPAEVVRHGTNGLLAARDDLEALAAALDRLMADARVRDDYGAAALETAEEYSPDLVMARWEALYTDLRTMDPGERARARADRAGGHGAATARNGMVFRDMGWEHATPQIDEVTTEEERIHRQHPNLIRCAGHLAEIRDDLLPHDAARRNLELVVSALDYFGVPYALVRDTGLRHRVMVTDERSEAALTALATSHDSQPVYALPLRPRGQFPQPVLAGMTAHLAYGDGVRVFRPAVTASRTLHYSADHGADLEFWRWDELGQCYVAPRPTAIGDRLAQSTMTPASLRVAGRDYPSFEPFTRRLTTDVDFPVDAVCALDADSKNQLLGTDTLRYALRSLAMFAPWVRRIFVVITGEVSAPEWLRTTHPDIVAVHDTAVGLHTLDELGEHLIYLPGGVFVGRPLGAERFFHSNGLARFVRAPADTPLGKPDPDDPADLAAAKRNRALLEDAFERCAAHDFPAAPAPLRRSVLAELAQRFPGEFTAQPGGSAPVSLHHHYAYLTGRAVPGRLRCWAVDTGDVNQHAELGRLLDARDHEAISITGSARRRVPLAEQRRMAHAFVRNYFPVASPYEREAPT